MHHHLHHIGGHGEGYRTIAGQSRVSARFTNPGDAVAIRAVFFIEGLAGRSSAV
jgi:hypothetical protein